MNRSELSRLKILETEKSIQNAFFELVAEKRFKEISVTDICNIAHISRGTFYLHYKDVLDLNSKIQKEFIDKILSMYQQAVPTSNKENLRRFVGDVADYVQQNKNIFNLMSNISGIGPFEHVRKIMIEESFKEKETVQNYSPEYNRIASIFCVSGVMGTIQGWVADQYRLPKEKLIEITVDLLERLS